MAQSAAWQRSEGKNPKGGLNAKGRASYKAQTGGTLKAPVKSGDSPRRASFLARMGNMPGPERNSKGEPTRLLLSLQAWGLLLNRMLEPKPKQYRRVTSKENEMKAKKSKQMHKMADGKMMPGAKHPIAKKVPKKKY